MKTEFTLKLTKPARSYGGDRYENETGSVTVYFPQTITRPEGEPVKEIKMTLET